VVTRKDRDKATKIAIAGLALLAVIIAVQLGLVGTIVTQENKRDYVYDYD
jgi:hypothetical protein